MSNVGVPPDIAAQMPEQGRRGIGGGAVENLATVGQRGAAMGNPNVGETTTKPAETKTADPESEEVTVCTNSACRINVEPEWNYCPKCNTDLLRGGPSKKLGIEYSEQDLSDYLFKGYIVKQIKILGKHTATLKSQQPKELEAIDKYIMSGDWGKEDDGTDRKVSDFYMRQMNAMCMTASALVKIDGESIGATLDDRMKWLQERGTNFVDILSSRVVLFNKSLAEYLKKEDTILGS